MTAPIVSTDPRRTRSNPSPQTLNARTASDEELFARAAHNLEAFQSRGVESVVDRPIENQLPDELWPVGEPTTVLYKSNKRDPNDPDGDGRQGVWKAFIHRHTADVGLVLYDTGKRTSGIPNRTPWPFDRLHIIWPPSVGWLGHFLRVEFRDVLGNPRTFVPPGATSWGLWAMPDAQALFACPYRGYVHDALVWYGGHLVITWRGIEG